MKEKMSKASMRKMAVLLTILSLLAATLAFAFTNPIKEAHAASWDIVPVEEVILSTDSGLSVKPEQTVELMTSTVPEYAIYTAKEVRYEFLSGSYYATIEGSKLTVNKNAVIDTEIAVRAVVDNIPSNNILVFTVVKTPVDSVSILNSETKINEGEALKINVHIEPVTASQKNMIFSIAEGVKYAFIGGDGVVRVHNDLPTGNLSIKVKATSASDVSKFDEKIFELYVPTKSLSLGAGNLHPFPNEEITLIPEVSSTASESMVEYEIIEGAEFVETFNGNNLKLVQSISAFNPKIKIKCSRDGIMSNLLEINVYVPVTSLTTVADKNTIKQGEMLSFATDTTPENSDRTNLRYHMAGGDDNQFAAISNSGILTAKTNIGTQTSSVFVYSEIDGIRSTPIEVIIEKPAVILYANDYYPTSKSTQSDSLNLTVMKDGVSQSNGAVIFNVISGQKYINSLVDGVLKIKTGITDYNPQIRLSASCGYYESGEIIIRINVLAEEIVISNTNIKKVEQQTKYSFGGKVLPLNASSASEKLLYSKNVDDSIATLSEIGELFIQKNAPIGTVITITITGPDGIIAYHTVTVVTVYATEIRLDNVINQNGSEILDGDKVYANDRLSFGVAFPFPFNVTETQKDYMVSLYSGDIDCVTLGQTEKQS